MGLSLNLANEWQVIGNTQPITLFRKIADGSYDAGTAVANAFSPSVKKDGASNNKGALINQKNSWIVWQVQTGSPDPKVGDVIQESSGVRWSVWKAEKQAWGFRFFLETVREN